MLTFVTRFMILGLLIGVSTLLLAHSKVSTTIPESGAVLTEAPAYIGLKFEGKIRLTKATVQLGEQDPIELDLSPYKGFQRHFSLLNPLASGGDYKIAWRGLGADGHVMQGKFSFKVK